jgi:hypothetical protein
MDILEYQVLRVQSVQGVCPVCLGLMAIQDATEQRDGPVLLEQVGLEVDQKVGPEPLDSLVQRMGLQE